MSDTVKQPIVARSPFAERYFYFTRHKVTPNGKGLTIVGQKTDVSDSVNHAIEQAIGHFLEYVAEKYDLKLHPPKTEKGEDGRDYLLGVKEVTGYEYYNDLIREWRENA